MEALQNWILSSGIFIENALQILVVEPDEVMLVLWVTWGWKAECERWVSALLMFSSFRMYSLIMRIGLKGILTTGGCRERSQPLQSGECCAESQGQSSPCQYVQTFADSQTCISVAEFVKSMKACCKSAQHLFKICQLLNVVLIHFRWRRVTTTRRSSRLFLLPASANWSNLNVNLKALKLKPGVVKFHPLAASSTWKGFAACKLHTLLLLIATSQVLALCVFVVADWDYIWFLHSI